MRNVAFFVIIALLGFFPSALLAQDNPLETLNTEAYLKLMDADTLASEGKKVEALDLFRKALTGYEDIRNKDANFKVNVVAYRLDYLRSKIAGLEKQVDPGAATPPTPLQVPEPGPTAAAEDFRKLYLDVREKMVRDSARLLELEKRSIDMVVTLREREEALTALRNESLTLRRDIDTARGDANRQTAQLQKEVQDFRRFNNLLQDRADKLETSQKELSAERDRLANDNAQLKEERDDFKGKFEHLSAQLDRVRELSNQQSSRFESLEKAYEEKSASTDKALAEALTQIETLQLQVTDFPLLEENILELNRLNDIQTKRIQTFEQEKSETETAFQSLETSSTNRINTLKNSLTDAETRVSDLQTSLDVARESLAVEAKRKEEERGDAARQMLAFTESLNEITLLRQLLADRDFRMKEQKLQHEQDIATLRTHVETLENPPPVDLPLESPPATPDSP